MGNLSERDEERLSAHDVQEPRYWLEWLERKYDHWNMLDDEDGGFLRFESAEEATEFMWNLALPDHQYHTTWFVRDGGGHAGIRAEREVRPESCGACRKEMRDE